MPYVSCMYAPPDETGMMGAETKEGENARITCIDDQGQTWWLTEDSQVGDWLDYVAKGGTVEPYIAAPGTEQASKKASKRTSKKASKPAPAPVAKTAAGPGTVYGKPLPE